MMTIPAPPQLDALTFTSAATTDIGRVRDTNEDAYLLDDAGQFWVIADGMGGHASGQVASKLAVEHIADFMRRWRLEPTTNWPFDIEPNVSLLESTVVTAVQVANLRIYNRSQIDEACEGMGTTVVLLHYDEDDGLAVGHVGDSRCYRLKQGNLERLTSDHSLAGQLTRSKLLTEQEARLHAGANVILRALGIEDEVNVDVSVTQPAPNETYLLCSDGLTDQLTDYEIERVLNKYEDDLQLASDTLVAQAVDKGGHDNITVALIRVDRSHRA